MSQLAGSEWNSSYSTQCGSVDFKTTFSNSLIIHQVKTKEITTVKEVAIPDLN